MARNPLSLSLSLSHTHMRVCKSSFATERKRKKFRGYTDAAGKPKSLVRKCSELNTIDVSNRNDKLYVELTGDNSSLVIIMIMIKIMVIMMRKLYIR